MNGNARDAIEFYQKALNAEIIFPQSFGEIPENPEFPLPEDAKERVSHATIKVGETELILSDSFPGQPHASGNQVTICITTDDAESSRQVFDALKQDGQVTMPLQETFFSPAYRSVTDKFGVCFQISTDKLLD
jgi:PhnB protein